MSLVGSRYNSGACYNSGNKYNSKIKLGLVSISGQGTINCDAEVEKTYRVVYELIFGPTILGINTKEKRVRKLYLIVSKTADAMMYVSYSTTEEGPFTSEVPIGEGASLTMAKKMLPIRTGNPASGFIYRVRIRGWGEVTIHEIALVVSPRR